MRPAISGILVLAACLAVLGATPTSAQVLEPPFFGSYSWQNLGPPPAVPPNLGGLTLKAGTTDRLIIGGAANSPEGALYEIGLTRDVDGHITGFSGEATAFAEGANNDGGVAYGPGGVLFLSRYDLNEVGQTKPGSTTTDRVIGLSALGVLPSIGALTFVPAGQPGGGSLKLASFNAGQWYDADVVPDGTGTYDVANVTAVPETVIPSPEGIVYVNPGSPHFTDPSVLISEWGAGSVGAYSVDGNGDPIVSTRRSFITGLGGAEGAFLDPVTGDFLFSTYEGGNRVIVVRGFAAPATLAVKTTVVNDDIGTNASADFSVHVTDGGDVAGSPQAGSADWSLYTLTAGTEYTVAADPLLGYTLSISGDCAADGTVTPAVGVEKSCIVTANDVPPATLKVITQVENDAGGAWISDDFTLHVYSNGGDVLNSPQGGSNGTDYLILPGSYTVAEDAARGYVGTITGDCAANGTVTLASNDSKTCTVTNRDFVVPDNGLVLESYGPSRTDFDWGFTEPFLAQTRGYLQDRSLFGPTGTVRHAYDVAPGIRVASARTLAGVDVFFTGWVQTGSYTAAEKTALKDFVRGGGTLIATTDDTGHTMVDGFGLTQGDGGGNPTVNTITAPDHAIANGAFGTVTHFNQYAATGHYPTLGPDAHEVGRYASGPGTTLAVIERGALGPGSGAAIFVADVDVFSDFGGATANATMIKNIFAFAAGEKARPSVSIGDIRKAEGDAGTTAFTFTVSLSAPSPSPVRVHYATTNGTATAPADYSAASGDLDFSPGQTSESVSVPVRGDTAVEADESFRVNLSNVTGGRLADPLGVATIANDDHTTQGTGPLPPPVVGKEVNALLDDGIVRIKLPGGGGFIELKEGQQIPVGTIVDTTKGRVTLVAAANKSGGTATATFYAGIFKVGQTKGSKPITTLTLVEKLSCARSSRASAARKKKKKRHLWGDGKGRFRTSGSYSSATVRGTKWLVQDTCTTTLTKVVRGTVTVRDFVKKKNVTVKAGKQYVARRH